MNPVDVFVTFDEASLGDWIYLSLYGVMLVFMFALAIFSNRGNGE